MIYHVESGLAGPIAVGLAAVVAGDASHPTGDIDDLPWAAHLQVRKQRLRQPQRPDDVGQKAVANVIVIEVFERSTVNSNCGVVDQHMDRDLQQPLLQCRDTLRLGDIEGLHPHRQLAKLCRSIRLPASSDDLVVGARQLSRKLQPETPVGTADQIGRQA